MRERLQIGPTYIIIISPDYTAREPGIPGPGRVEELAGPAKSGSGRVGKTRSGTPLHTFIPLFPPVFAEVNRKYIFYIYTNNCFII